MPVDMPAPIILPAPILVGPDARPPVVPTPQTMPAAESVLIGQTADGQIGWVLVPKSQPVPPVRTVPLSVPGAVPQQLTNVRQAWPEAPAVRAVQRQAGGGRWVTQCVNGTCRLVFVRE